MKTYTVTELARLAGITVRTLHHYDGIGLLRPAFTGANRYRHYGREELLRLQQILLHRELGLSLAEIGAILDDPGFDHLAALRQQRERMAREAVRYAGLVATIDRTIADLEGEREMDDEDLYSGIVPPEKQAEYEAWLVERHGPEMARRIEQSKAATAGRSKADIDAAMKELAAAEQGLAEAMRRGLAPEDEANAALLARHRDWVALMWGRACPPAAYAGLADTYLSHPDFVARYERIAAGFSAWLPAAMKAWAARREG